MAKNQFKKQRKKQSLKVMLLKKLRQPKKRMLLPRLRLALAKLNSKRLELIFLYSSKMKSGQPKKKSLKSG